MGLPQPTLSISRILVAENDRSVRKLFASKLRTAGYSVTEAESASEALDILRHIHYRLLILDLDMPDQGTDSFELLKIVRNELPHLHVLAVSGHKNGALLEAAECLGAKLSLDKGSALAMLVPSTRKLLGE